MTTHFDVFNGDADGLCALQQLRLESPIESTLVTGVKRDNALLARVPARAGDTVTVLDLALPGNRDALCALLARGVRVRYFDHHEPGEIPSSPALEITIDTDPATCTSVVVDRALGGRRRPWAIVGAFGDNLAATARRLAAEADVDGARLARWQALGECLNYNAYGFREDDLVYPPAQLHQVLRRYAGPDAFLESEPHFERLRRTRDADLAWARSVEPVDSGAGWSLRVLADSPSARRVIGSLANALAVGEPHRAHAVVAPLPDGTLQVSLRVPASARTTADSFCRQFGGGGRRIAAGIDGLARERLAEFAAALARRFATTADRG